MEDEHRLSEDEHRLSEDENPLLEHANPSPVFVHPLPEDEELPESEELLTEEYDSVFEDVSLEDDDVILTDDDVVLEVIQEVSEEEDELPEDNQAILAAIQEDVEDPHKLAIEQIDLALAHLSSNADKLKVLETHIGSLENGSDSSEDHNLEVDQTTINELKALVARLEDEVHCIQIQQLQAQINALNVSAAASDQKLSENRKQLALKERVLQDSSALICSLTNALDNARNETKSVQASLNIFKRRCHKAERKSLADRRRVSSAAARHEASLIEQDSLQARIDELEAQIDSMEVVEEETKEPEVSAETREENDTVVNTETPDSTKTPDKVTPNESKLIAQLALMERGYNEMLGYTMMLEIVNEKLKKEEPNELVLAKLMVLERSRDAALEEIERQQIQLREVQYKLDSLEGMMGIPITPYIEANLAAAAAMERSQQDFYAGEPMPMYPNMYTQPRPVPRSPKFVVPTTLPGNPFIIHLGSSNSANKDSTDSDSSSEEAQINPQDSTETVQPPTTVVQEEAVTSTEEVQHSAETLVHQAQDVTYSSTHQMTVNIESQTPEVFSSTEHVQPSAIETQQAPPMIATEAQQASPMFATETQQASPMFATETQQTSPMIETPPISMFQQPGYVIPPPFDPFCAYRPGSHSFVYKETRDNRRCRWCWCALIPRNTVQCQVCNILVHNTCKKVVPFTCGYPGPIWNHYINLPVSHTEIPATPSYTMPNPSCWVIFHRVRSARRYVTLYGSNINIYARIPGPYDLPLEIIPLQMCGLMPRLTVDLTNRFRMENVDKCIAYQQMVTPNPNRRQGMTFILEFGNHWDRECFIDALSLFIATLTPPGPYDHFQNK
ncbi:hypothetical protein CBL_12979 [Carabus blaptoides fortunei]